MWRIPALAKGILLLNIILLCCAYTEANLSVDSDVEEGKAMEKKTFGNQKRGPYAQMVEEYKNQLNKTWWANRSCKHSYLPTALSGCSKKSQQKCFGVDILYSHRVETDEPFPHWIELLRHFPKCWRSIAPLVCMVHFRPCTLMDNPGDDSHRYTVIELFNAQLCNDTRLHCDFALRHFPPTDASYLKCDTRIRQVVATTRNDSLYLHHQQRNSNDSLLPVYNTNCNPNYTLASRDESLQLEQQAKSCLAPLVYVNGKDVAQQTHALPLIDECYIPCSSTIFDASALSVLRIFSFLSFLLVLLFSLLLLSRAKVILIFDVGIFICCLAIVSTFFIALAFALSPFIGTDVVCLLDGKIRRFSGSFVSANGNDILCMLEAAYLKICLIFVFWTSFIAVCNEFCAKSLFLQQISAFGHILLSLFIILWHREISIDPVSKVCHYFHFHSAWPTIVDFVSLLLVAFFIIILSKTKFNPKKGNKKSFPQDQVLITGPDNEPSLLRETGKRGGGAVEEVHGDEIVRNQPLSSSQRLVDEVNRQISPLSLLFAYFGFILSFYPLAVNDESDLLFAQLNCSLSAISTGRWNDDDHLRGCQRMRRIPLWYYANSLVVVFNLILMLFVMSGSLKSLLQSNNNSSSRDFTSCGGDEGEDNDNNKKTVELDSLTEGKRGTTNQQLSVSGNGMNCTTFSNNSGNNHDNCTPSVAGDSIYSHLSAAIDSSSPVHHPVLNTERSRRRRLSNLERGAKRNGDQRIGRTTTMGKQTLVNNDHPMRLNAVPTPPSELDSLAVAYAIRHQPPIPGGGILPPLPMALPQPEANSNPIRINGPTPLSCYSDSIASAYAQLRNQTSSPAGVVNTCPTCFVGALPQPPVTAAAAPIINNHWYLYLPPDICPTQSCNGREDEIARTESAMGKVERKEEQMDGTEGKDSEGPKKERNREERSEGVPKKERNREERSEGVPKKERNREERSEESEVPASNDEEVDDTNSNDFCSDSPDSTEEFNWNERCRKAAQSQPSGQL